MRSSTGLYGGVLFLLVALDGDRQDPPRAGTGTDASRTTIDNLNARIRAWWKMGRHFRD